ncbi:uncharacterized protein LOC127035900 isoform X3 [Gopherus flavomarginatus]|uniref:uncharacterized protein LOC127035900 isoform X3 n=1 Tax=Gopherus flavomarginatus TaxID=286002 RepID=UPI0021CBCDF3|nr:uncharacterized protein LOC127035900 isoform X3 [Gopherus flavomarginatus]
MTGRACKLIRNGPHFFLNCLASSFLFSILTPFPFASPSRKNLPASPRVSHQLRPASHPFAHGPCTLQSVYQTDVHVLPMHQTGPSAAGGMGEERAGCPCLMRQGEHPLMSVSRCWPWSNRVDISCSGFIANTYLTTLEPTNMGLNTPGFSPVSGAVFEAQFPARISHDHEQY